MYGLIPWRRNDKSNVGPLALSGLSSDWEKVFGRFFDDAQSSAAQGPLAKPTPARLPLDLRETSEEIRLRVEVPGIDPNAIDVSLVGDVLSISGEKAADAESEEQGSFYSERSYGAFRRTLELRTPVDPDGITASHENGVLTVTLRKADTVQPKRIEVKRG